MESQVIAVKDVEIDRARSVEAVVMGAPEIVLDALKLCQKIERRQARGHLQRRIQKKGGSQQKVELLKRTRGFIEEDQVVY